MRTTSLLDIDIWHCRYGLSQDKCMKNVLCTHLAADTFDELQIPLVIVATDLYSGELVPMGSGILLKLCRPPAQSPSICPCEHMGRVLVDGGVVNPVPAKSRKTSVLRSSSRWIFANYYPERSLQISSESPIGALKSHLCGKTRSVHAMRMSSYDPKPVRLAPSTKAQSLLFMKLVNAPLGTACLELRSSSLLIFVKNRDQSNGAQSVLIVTRLTSIWISKFIMQINNQFDETHSSYQEEFNTNKKINSCYEISLKDSGMHTLLPLTR